MLALIVVAICSLVVSFVLTPFFRDFFGFLEMVDRPDSDRKIHARAVPRIGGIPLAVTYFLAVLALEMLGLLAKTVFNWQDPSILLMIRLWPAVALIFATGLFDDFKGLTPGWKLAGQTIAAGYACWAGVRLATPPGYPSILMDLVSILWLVFCANAINLIDGMDGLAAGVALLGSISLLLAAVFHHQPGLALTMVPLIGGLLGFLCYNFSPATVFLGDSGSLLVGFLLGCAGIMWNRHASTGLGRMAPLVALAFPFAEVILSISRRFLRNRPIFGADRNHIHHRLLSMGYSQRSAALLIYGVSALAAVFAVLQTILRPQLATMMLLFFVAITYLGFRWLKYPEFGAFRQFIFRGEFRRALGTNIYMKEYTDALARARTVEECWKALRDTCRYAQFSSITLKMGGGKPYTDVLQPGSSDPKITFHIVLSPSDSVIFGLNPSVPSLAMLVGPIAEGLQSKMIEAGWASKSEAATVG